MVRVGTIVAGRNASRSGEGSASFAATRASFAVIAEFVERSRERFRVE